MKRLLLAFVLTVVGVLCGPAFVTHALSNDPKQFISADNTFYAYVKGGEKISASFLRVDQNEPFDTVRGDVTVTLDGPQFQQQTCVLKKDVPIGQGCTFAPVTAAKTGIWRIQFSVPANARTYYEVSPVVKWAKNLFSWNITVANGSGEHHGRVWTERYATRQPAPSQYITDITNYYISEDGYIYRAITKGYNGQISTLSADSIGIRKGTGCVSAYQSTEVSNQDYSPALGACGNAYKLFFEEPAGDLPAKARKWDGVEDWVRPNISRPSVSELHFESDKSKDQLSGTISFFLRNFIGQYQVKVDVDNDGSFNGQNDVLINQQMKKLSNGLQQVHFQGVDKGGQIILPSQTNGVQVNITKVAEIHLVAADVEGRTGGVELVRLSGDNAPTTRICWNDTELGALSDEFTPKMLDGRSCPDSMKGVHGWVYNDFSWGNARYIDDWIYASAKLMGNNQITYPDAVAAKAGVLGVNWMLVGGVVVTILVLGGGIAFVIFRRKKNKPVVQIPQQPVPPNTDPSNSGQPQDQDRY
jgi:hypothetical protein